jgi:hypothetical protein
VKREKLYRNVVSHVQDKDLERDGEGDESAQQGGLRNEEKHATEDFGTARKALIGW